MVLLAALAVAGCICCNNPPGIGGPAATVTGTPSGKLPTTPAGLNDMSYLWNNVHYLKERSTTVSTIPDMNGLETTMTWNIGNGNYKGQPALLLKVATNSSADQSKVDNNFGFNMSFDVYFSRVGDVLTMLGGYAYIQLGNSPEDIMKGEINVSQLIENSKKRGHIDPETGEQVMDEGPATFSPTIDLSRPITITDMDSEEKMYNSMSTGYDINMLMTPNAMMYQGAGNITLTPAGRETLRVGNRNINCYKYTWTVDMANGRADYTAWYSPEFPASPLKTVANLNNGQTVQTSVIDEFR